MTFIKTMLTVLKNSEENSIYRRLYEMSYISLNSSLALQGVMDGRWAANSILGTTMAILHDQFSKVSI